MGSLENCLVAVILVLVIAVALVLERAAQKKSERFYVINPPPDGWPAAKTGGVDGGTVPAWGEDFSRPPY